MHSRADREKCSDVTRLWQQAFEMPAAHLAMIAASKAPPVQRLAASPSFAASLDSSGWRAAEARPAVRAGWSHAGPTLNGVLSAESAWPLLQRRSARALPSWASIMRVHRASLHARHAPVTPHQREISVSRLANRVLSQLILRPTVPSTQAGAAAPGDR
ncbi:hypothetical protein T492DRAFT_81335 [Pavlovales sp. CCMP2436]|nr:hypothetical protein T492DRAFT_81335 [Pavlovales sp. CCMP2436]